MFMVAIGGLVVVALAFCWPLWRASAPRVAELAGPEPADERAGHADEVAQREAYNAALYQDFVAELEEDRRLDDASRAALAADKARQLLDESTRQLGDSVSSLSLTSDHPAGLGLGFKVLAASLLVAGSGLVYWLIGTPAADQLVKAREVLTLPALAEVDGNQNDPAIVALRAYTDSLRVRVKRMPDEAASWYLLGIGELKLQSYAAASDAFEAAHKLVGADSNLDLYWLQARLLADNGTLSEATQAIARRVLETQPNQPMVLNMLALAAYRSNDFAKAVGYLNSALSNNLTEDQREMLSSGFEQARQSLGVAGSTFDVDLNVIGEPPAGAVLFVIARPVGGGMPYAVVRRPANNLPAQVRLDDAVSMNPANPLSAAKDVEIVARMSLTGRPQAGPGDWQWQSGPLAAADSGQPVVVQAELAAPRH